MNSNRIRQSCTQKMFKPEFFFQLKNRIKDLGYKERFKVTRSSCMGPCELGVTMVVYPDATWYGKITVEDVEEFIQSHLLEGKALDRLRIDNEGE